MRRAENTDFNWLCNNPKKIGKSIYDVLMQSETAIETLDNPQVIVAVANHEEQAILKKYFQQKGMVTMLDYFFFC